MTTLQAAPNPMHDCSSDLIARQATLEARWLAEVLSPAANSPSSGTAAREVGRLRHIRLRAYLKAQERGFKPGHEVADWLEAEREIDAAGLAADGEASGRA
jgi:hypothetical protein